jgi:hypothetical protein
MPELSGTEAGEGGRLVAASLPANSHDYDNEIRRHD